jgi:hypothetical protein
MSEIELEHACDLYQAILAADGAQPVIVDSDDLIADPAATMAAYCAAVGIPFSRPASSAAASPASPGGSPARRYRPAKPTA